jgi:hypothetical protein
MSDWYLYILLYSMKVENKESYESARAIQSYEILILVP